MSKTKKEEKILSSAKFNSSLASAKRNSTVSVTESPVLSNENDDPQRAGKHRSSTGAADLMRSTSKKHLKKKASIVAAAAVTATSGITSGSLSATSSLSSSKQELNHVTQNLVDINNNEIVAATVGGGVGGGGELFARSTLKTEETSNLTTNSIEKENECKQVLSYGSLSLTSSPTSLCLSPISPFSSQKTSSKSNDRFHQLFPSVPLDETVVDSM